MFWIDADADYAANEGWCPSCNRVHRMPDTSLDLAVQATALNVRRTMGPEFAPEKVIRKLGADPAIPYLEMELEAALALVNDAESLIPSIRDMIEPYLTEDMRAEDVYTAIEKANRHWRNNSFEKGTSAKFEEAMTLAVATGVVTASDAAKVDRVFRRRMIDGMVRAGKYYSNEFFNRQVMPSLITSVEHAMAGDTSKGLAGYRLVQATLNSRLKTVPYWNVVASAAASRSYHYGLARAGLNIGKTTYRFVAVMDRRTSDICVAMNGTEWSLMDAVSLMERIADAESPEDVKTIAPWGKAADIEGMNAREIREMGMFMPPLHGRCRSTIAIF